MGSVGPRPDSRTYEPGSIEFFEYALADVDDRIWQHLDSGDYLRAFQLLPGEAALWEELLSKTDNCRRVCTLGSGKVT